MKIEIDETKKHLNALSAETIELLKNDQQRNQSDDYRKLKELEQIAMQPHNHKINKIPEVKLPDFNFLKLNIDQVKKLPTDELLKLLSGESHKGAIRDSMVQLISNEILSREIKEATKPNWTIKPDRKSVV